MAFRSGARTNRCTAGASSRNRRTLLPSTSSSPHRQFTCLHIISAFIERPTFQPGNVNVKNLPDYMCEWASHHRHSFSPNSARLETHRRGSIGPPSKTQRAHQTSVCTGHPEGQSDPCPRRSIRPLSQHQTPGESNRQLPAENPQCLSDLRLQQIPRRSNTPLPLHQIINTSYQKLPFGSGNDPDPASDTRRGQSDLYNRHSEGQSNTYPSTRRPIRSSAP